MSAQWIERARRENNKKILPIKIFEKLSEWFKNDLEGTERRQRDKGCNPFP